MKRAFVVSVALVLMVLFSASMILAQEKAPAEKEKEMGSCKKEMRQLSQEQKAKLQQLVTEHRMKMIDMRAERGKLLLKLREEWTKPEPSETAMQEIVKQLSAVREKIQMSRIEHLFAVKQIVGDEWRMFLKERMFERQEMMRERGMMRRFGGGWGARMHEGMGPLGNEENEEAEETEETGADAPGEERVIRIVREGPGLEHMMMGGGCMGMKGEGMGQMKGSCMMRMEGSGCCAAQTNNWDAKMFRRFGTAGCCHQGCCMMKESMGCKGGMKVKCTATCTKGEAPKEIKCQVEMKKESEKKE